MRRAVTNCQDKRENVYNSSAINRLEEKRILSMFAVGIKIRGYVIRRAWINRSDQIERVLLKCIHRHKHGVRNLLI